MAEALLRELDGAHFDAFSAGLEPADKVHEAAMSELRHGFSSLELLNPKSWLEFTSAWAPEMDFIIALCGESALVDTRAFPGTPRLRQWPLVLPPVAMTAHDVARVCENAFWQILRRVEDFIAAERHVWPPSPVAATTSPWNADACDLLWSGQ